MRVETTAEQLFFTTVFIEGDDGLGTNWTGTGFVFAVNTEQGQANFVVTNKHVLQGAMKLQIRFLRANGDQPMLGQTVTARWDPFGDHLWTGHPVDDVDVAVLPLQTVLDHLAGSGHMAYVRSLSEELLPNVAAMQKVDELERVIFIGYPIGLYDTANFTPIARQGMTATPMSLDYQGLPAFLIDASVYPGSSGSPVCLYNKGMYQTRGTNDTIIGNRLHLLGVLAAVHSQTVGAPVVKTQALTAHVKQPVGLGLVFRGEAITKCIDIILAAAGLHRVAATQPTTASKTTVADEQVADAVAEVESDSVG